MDSIPRITSIPVFGLVVAGCVRHLPPAPVPPPVAPQVAPAPPPPEGQARMVIDVVDGPAPVQRVQLVPSEYDIGDGRHAYSFGERNDVVCSASPCVADLPRGNVLLGFPVIGKPHDLEVELVHVGREPAVYRRSLSVYEDHTGGTRIFGIIATSFGGASLITGTALLPIGLANDNHGLTTAGGITLGAGAALLALGIWAIRADAPTYRPGSSNHFPLGAP